MTTYTFCVITDAKDSYAAAIGLKAKREDSFGYEELPPEVAFATMVSLGMPAFTTGEILVLDQDGREVNGLQRKPSKWDVETFETENIATAILKAVDATRRAMEDRIIK